MGKHDSIVVFGTAMGMVALFGFMAYYKGKKNGYHNHANELLGTGEKKEIGEPAPFYERPVNKAFYGTGSTGGCGCGK